MPPWEWDERWLSDEERLIVTCTNSDELVAWYELAIIRQTYRLTGEDIGPVVRVAYFTVLEERRGRHPHLVKQMICDMIRRAAKLAEDYTVRAIVIDPAHDAFGIERALRRRPEAQRMLNYPWPFVLPTRALTALEARYCV